MFVCGIDVGTRTVKAVILRDSKILARSINLVGFDVEKDIQQTLDSALSQVCIDKNQLAQVVATGAGREAVPSAKDRPTVITCAAKGIQFVFPGTKTVIDVGAEEGRAIRCEDGKVMDFVVNEKCAAGAGTFIENMSRALEITVDQFGPLALKSQKAIPMNAQCAVFAESEVVSLIHSRTSKEDIARAVCEAMAGRIGSMSRRIKIAEPVALAGGVAKNIGFVEALKRDLQLEVKVADEPEFVCAVGAALMASESCR